MAARRRREPVDRAWLVGTSRGEFALSEGVEVGQLHNIVAGADLVTDPALTLAEVKSDWFAVRLMFHAWFHLTSTDSPTSLLSRRVLQCMLLTGDLADQQDWATQLGTRATADMWDSDNSWWKSSRRILQQDHVPLYRFGRLPQAASQATVNTGTSGAAMLNELGAHWGPPAWHVDLDSRWSLDEDTDLNFAVAVPPSSFDPNWADGDVVAYQYAWKILFQHRRG